MVCCCQNGDHSVSDMWCTLIKVHYKGLCKDTLDKYQKRLEAKPYMYSGARAGSRRRVNIDLSKYLLTLPELGCRHEELIVS